MDFGHEHFQELAVGHVLGGLEPDDAAEFRSHLVGCRDCRARVSELRGIASDLERADRDERARALVQTELAEPEETPEASGARRGETDASGPRIGVRHVTIAVIGVMLLAGAMGFWNLHLRTGTSMLTTLAEQHAHTLEVLAAGITVEVEADHPVRGLAAVDGDHVALTLTGVDEPADGQRVVAWLRDDAEVVPAAELRSSGGDEGTVAVVLEDQGAQHLEVTLEDGEVPDQPGGPTLATVDLQPVDAADRSPG